MTYEKEIYADIVRDLFKVTKILGDLDHNFAFTKCGGSYSTIVRSVEQILLTIAEELKELRNQETSDN